MIVDESNYEILERVSKLTLTDYEIRWFDKKNIYGYIETDNLISMLEDLLCEIDTLEEKYKDLEQDIEDNYKRLTYEEQIDYNPHDFHEN